MLIGRLLARDPGALAEIYDRHGRAVYALALRILCDPTGAEDVTHDVFLKLWWKPERYRAERGSLRAWLLSVAHNRAIDLWRHRQLGPRRFVTDEPDSQPMGADASVDLGEDAVRAEEVARVRWALAQIPRAQREVIELAFLEGKTHVEISAELGEPLGTAKTRIRLGMRKLRALLAGMETAHEPA